MEHRILHYTSQAGADTFCGKKAKHVFLHKFGEDTIDVFLHLSELVPTKEHVHMARLNYVHCKACWKHPAVQLHLLKQVKV